MTQPTRPTLPQLVKQARVAQLALLDDLDPEAAAWVRRLRAEHPGKPGLVVLGETNRGKSSLVNALIGVAGLSPVDASVATSTYLVFDYAEEWQACACYPGQLPPVPIEPGALAMWVSDAATPPAGALPPSHVEVRGPAELLADVSIVDTPGVGGLDAAHGELAREAATAATALLFVVDASAPFSVGEIAFLRSVADQVETVLFALSKVDRYRGWRQVLEADRALLAQHVPRLADAPFLPVSARLAELAATAPAAQAAMLREQSGVDELAGLIRRTLPGRALMLAEANTLRALDTALAALAVRLDGDRRALSAGEEHAAALRARMDELTGQRRSATRGWQVRLRSEIQSARLEFTHEVSRQVRDLQSWFRTAIDKADRERLAMLPREVDTALQVLSGRIGHGVAARLDQVADVVLGELFQPDELAVIRAQFARAGRPPVVLRAADRRPPSAEDRLMVFMGMSGGMGVGKVALLPFGAAAAGGVFLVPMMVIGLGAGLWIARTRRHTADKQHLKQWLSDAVAEARATLDQTVSQQLIDAESQLSLALDEALGRRIAGIEAELRQVGTALKLDTRERAEQLALADRRVADVASGRARIRSLLDGIASIRDRTPEGRTKGTDATSSQS